MPDPNFVLRKHEEDVTVIDLISTDCKDILCSGDIIGNLKIWNLETRRPFIEFKMSENKNSSIYHITNSVNTHINDQYLITQLRDDMNGFIHCYDFNNQIINYYHSSMDNNHCHFLKPIFKFDTKSTNFCRCNIVTKLNTQITMIESQISMQTINNQKNNNDEIKEEHQTQENQNNNQMFGNLQNTENNHQKSQQNTTNDNTQQTKQTNHKLYLATSSHETSEVLLSFLFIYFFSFFKHCEFA